jgi:hypothetical protein
MARAGGRPGHADGDGPSAGGFGAGATGRGVGGFWVTGDGVGASGALYVLSGVGMEAGTGDTIGRTWAGTGLEISLGGMAGG